MRDLGEEIRTYIESGTAPITADELETRCQSRQGSSAWRPRWTKDRTYRIGIYATVVSVAVCVALVVGITLTPLGVQTDTTPVSAANVLHEAAQNAADQTPLVPGPGQFLYVRTLEGAIDQLGDDQRGPLARFYVNYVTQIWSAPGTRGVNSIDAVEGPRFLTAADRALWSDHGSPPISQGAAGGGTSHYYDVADLPTQPSRIEAYLAAQPYLEVDQTQGRNAVWKFTTAVEFLQNGASAAQRAALFGFMATLPGVSNLGARVTVGTGQTGTALSIPSDEPGMATEVILDPETSQVLEERLVVTNPAQAFLASPAKVNAGLAMVPLRVGQALDYVDFLYDGIADSDGAPPSGAPRLPTPWPDFSSAPPVAGTAYP